MPNGWVHAAIDLLAYGKSYLDLHKEKDEAYKTLGWKHRKKGHEWYQAFGKRWTLDEPFPTSLKDQFLKIRIINGPNKSERQMAYVDHDYIDKIWNGLSAQQRKYREGFFMWVILSPQILREWAGIDILESKIQRVVDDREVWEYCPGLRTEYNRLRKYVEIVRENDRVLQDMLTRYGKKE